MEFGDKVNFLSKVYDSKLFELLVELNSLNILAIVESLLHSILLLFEFIGKFVIVDVVLFSTIVS